MTDMNRPGQRTNADRAKVEVSTAEPTSIVVDVFADLTRRREESVRLPRYEDTSARRDPLDPLADSGPSTFGLDPADLTELARQHWRAGWQTWEIQQRFGVGEAA